MICGEVSASGDRDETDFLHASCQGSLGVLRFARSRAREVFITRDRAKLKLCSLSTMLFTGVCYLTENAVQY